MRSAVVELVMELREVIMGKECTKKRFEEVQSGAKEFQEDLVRGFMGFGRSSGLLLREITRGIDYSERHLRRRWLSGRRQNDELQLG